jgi:hypothetical protein
MATPRETRVSYDYISAHRRFWENDVSPHMEVIMRNTRDMEIRCRNTLLYGEFVEAHAALTAFVQSRADEGHRAHYDIAQRLAEIKKHYETHEAYRAQLMQSGGFQP